MVTAYEFSKNALFEKIGLVKADATEKSYKLRTKSTTLKPKNLY